MGDVTISIMDILEYIEAKQKPTLIDGGMGTQLDAMGLPMGGRNNLSQPDAVLTVHKQYSTSGAEILITNTLTMNPVYIESEGNQVDVREVNFTGADLARKGAGEEKYVLGDIGSTGKIMQPFGPLTKSEASEAYRIQATALIEGGVDGFIIETMFDLQEALCALRACKAVSDLPVIVSMAFRSTRNGGQTIMGNISSDCAVILQEEGASVVGANCGDIDPFEMAEIVAAMTSAVSLPVVAQPNAGIPVVISGRSVFKMEPKEFSQGIQKCIDAGAALVGGCCGTTPAHIQAVADMLGSG